VAGGSITKSTVDSLRPSGREEYLWDAKLSGFGVKVTPSGSKSYLVQYRMGGRGAPTKRYTLGKHGAPWTPAKAREEAERVLTEIRKGIDPQETKRRNTREAIDLAYDKYAARFLELYGTRSWNAKTLGDSRRFLISDKSPARQVLGRKPLPLITRSDVTAVLDQIPATSPGYARNLYSVLRKLFSWAVSRGDIDRSPFEGIAGPRPVKSRDRVLEDDELRLVWLASERMDYPFGPFYRFLVCSGQRREEVSAIGWQELSRERLEWTLPADRAKNGKPNVIPLNKLATDLLDQIAGSDDWPRNGYVYTTTGKGPISGFSKAKTRLGVHMAQIACEVLLAEGVEADEGAIAPWRVHDLRRTFATGLQRLGVRFEVTEALLNHVSGARSGVAGVYQRHDWKCEKRAALDAWGENLLLLLGRA
jgi:integrase